MSSLSCKRIALALGGASESKAGWVALCPAHDDKSPSLSIRTKAGSVLVHCFAGCSQDAVVKALKQRRLWHSESAHPPSERNSATVGCTLAEYAKAKSLKPNFLERKCQLKDTLYSGRPAVEIPYHDIEGNHVSTRYRIGIDGKDKFRWRTGDKPCLYGLGQLAEMHRKNDYICVVEGESDCHTLWSVGIPSIGVPGASLWMDERDAPHLKAFKVIYLVFEPDEGGLRLREKLAKSPLRDIIRIMRLGRFKDANEYFQHDPETFHARWQRRMSKALALDDDIEVSRDRQRKELRENCKDISESTDVLSDFSEDFRSLGAVGVSRHAKLIFLATVSRLFDRPISIAVKGPSSGGKSFLVESVLKFFPITAFHALTAMSERAIAYSAEPLKHRMLVIYEAAGMSGEVASYLIRSLLSEGRIRYETVQSSPQGTLEARLIEKEGPTGLIITTTAIALHPENETRLVSITVTDTPKQTRAIMIAQAEKQNGQLTDFAKWHAFHEWIATGPREVHIPFARILAENTRAAGIRLRRDFPALLGFIAAHALLHQASRDQTADGRVIATLQDYAVIHRLIARHIQEGVEATVPTQVREIVELISRLFTDGEGIALPRIAAELNLDKSSASRRARRAADLGYIKNLEDRKGRPARYVPGDALPEDEAILPAPEQLDKHCAIARQKRGGQAP